MPNHCYAKISVEEKYKNKLKEISEVGLCRYYRPMPEELKNTSSPVWIVSQEEYDLYLKNPIDKETTKTPITKEIQAMYIEKYGADNWYDWSHINWGTKWGCYNHEFDDAEYGFTTAWGPVDNSIIELLSNDIPSFTYYYEEEQGWGAKFEFLKGEQVYSLEWDLPEWDDTENDDVGFLSIDHENMDGKYKKGYYLYHTLNFYAGKSFEEALEVLNKEVC
jgi:hypothetical protein